jgi:hypothetical protein
VALTDSDLSELLAALKAGEMTDTRAASRRPADPRVLILAFVLPDGARSA